MWNFGPDPRVADLNVAYGCGLQVELQVNGASTAPPTLATTGSGGSYSFAVTLLAGTSVAVVIITPISAPLSTLVGSVSYNFLPTSPTSITLADLQLTRTFTVSPKQGMLLVHHSLLLLLVLCLRVWPAG